MISLLLLVQLLVIVLDHVQVVNAARNAVRAAAVSADPIGTAEMAAQRSYGADDRDKIVVVTRVDQTWVTVVVSHALATDVPIVGRLIPDLTVSSRFSMMLEPPLG